MKLTHAATVLPHVDGICKVTALAWSPNNRKLAAVTVDRIVHLFDETGERRDRFTTKPNDKGGNAGPKNYIVRSMAFSPDSDRLAIAQSDNVVFVYKVGLDWDKDYKKKIVNKIFQSSPVTCLIWPAKHPMKCIFGLADGKVKVAMLERNKAATLFASDSYVVSCCPSPDGHGVLTGHLNCAVYRCLLEDGNGGGGLVVGQLFTHSTVPYALAWGQSIVAAGADGNVSFYHCTGADQGTLQRNFDYTSDESVKEFGCAVCAPSGRSIVVGNYNKSFVYSFNQATQTWDEAGVREVENLLSVTALAWKQDGSRLALGALCGVVDLYDACLRRVRYRGLFEFTYVSLSEVIIKTLSSGATVAVGSKFTSEISAVDIYHERYVVARTAQTLIVGDLGDPKLGGGVDRLRISEFTWGGGGDEKFFFENEAVCMIFNHGQLVLIEYGSDDALASCRTEHIKKGLVSVRINERPRRGIVDRERENKMMAYLLDVHTIRVVDLGSNTTAATVSHEAKIEWLQLNSRGDLLLFRDDRRRLHLVDVATEERSPLLSYCTFVSWVPGSDVVVAQNHNKMAVWYSIHSPDKVTTTTIRGKIEEVERLEGQTRVLVAQDMQVVAYQLDDGLIGFGTAIDDRDYVRAMDTLSRLALSPEVRGMWQHLGTAALAAYRDGARGSDAALIVCEHCAAALGDAARAKYLHSVNMEAAKIDAADRVGAGQQHWRVKAMLALLQRDVKGAEAMYVRAGHAEEAVQMYHTMHRWTDALAVAESANLPEADDMRREYLSHLLDSGQEEEAARLKEREGNYSAAIELYLKAGMPAKAAVILRDQRALSGNVELVEQVASALERVGMSGKAGALYERLDDHERALRAYREGSAFQQAITLARRHFPEQVVALEEEWGNYLVETREVEAAVNHYVEAGNLRKAIGAALDAKQTHRAEELIDTLAPSDGAKAEQLYVRLARQAEKAKRYRDAERLFEKGRDLRAAVEMYVRAEKWDAVHSVASSFMSSRELDELFVRKAHALHSAGRLKDAEVLFVRANAIEEAAAMYRDARQFDQLTRLLEGGATPQRLKEEQIEVGRQLEKEGQQKEAEQYYCAAGEWRAALTMYEGVEMWDEAIRVAKVHGGREQANGVAFKWARSLGGEQGSKLLQNLGLVREAIEYHQKLREFPHAFELAERCLPEMLPEVHLAAALDLEDSEQYEEAEERFIDAGKPKEAVEMYLHLSNYNAAMRVAEAHEPSVVPKIRCHQAAAEAQRGNLARAEQLYIQARQPGKALDMYMQAQRWSEATRLAKTHLPQRLHSIPLAQQRAAASKSSDGRGGGGGGGVDAARLWEETGDYARAIDAYLNVTPEDLGGNLDRVEEAWETAVTLASKHAKGRYTDVVTLVAQRLVEIRRHEAAAELFKDVERYKDAIDCYIRATPPLWDRARQLARTAAPEFRAHVEKANQAFLLEHSDAHGLVRMGDAQAALDIFARNGEWAKLFETAREKAPNLLGVYATKYARSLWAKRDAEAAVSELARWGVAPTADSIPFYHELAQQLLHRTMQSEQKAEQRAARAGAGRGAGGVVHKSMTELREMMSKLSARLDVQAQGGGSEMRALHAQSTNLLLVAHYAAMRCAAQLRGDTVTAAGASVALLFWCGLYPADKAFFLAAKACQAAGWTNLGYILAARYLDVSDAIEEGSPLDEIDNDEFVDSGLAPPTQWDGGLPSARYPSHDADEEVRTSVLSGALDKGIDQEEGHRQLRQAMQTCNKARAFDAPMAIAKFGEMWRGFGF